MDIYLHGIETIEKNDGPRPVQTIDTGVIGAVFTAPNADPELWPLNKRISVLGYQGFPGGLGTAGTGAEMFEGIFAQATRASQTIVAVRVEQGQTLAETMSNAIGSSLTKTGLHALRNAPGDLMLTPKLLIASGLTSTRPTDGVTGIEIDEGGEGYTEPPTVTITAGDGGAAPVGFSAVAIVEGGAVIEVVVTNPGMGGNAPVNVVFTGGGGTGAEATAALGVVGNPVTAEMLALARRFRAGVVANGPNTTPQDAVAYRMDWSNPNLYVVDPYVKVFRNGAAVSEPSAARVAGLQARVDYDEGFWVSASNHVIEGIIGTSRSVEHSLSDPSVESQYLNKNGVATIVRSPSGGYKLWGLRAAESDPLHVFWSVRRAHNTIIDSIERAHEPFIGRPFSRQILVDIAETVNSALRRWQALGASLGGRVWLDPSINTKESWANGHLYVSYDNESPAPIEHITFLFSRNTGYYEVLADEAVREIARLSGRAL